MRLKRIASLACPALVLALTLPGAASASPPADSSVGRDWPTVGGDSFNSRYSPLKTINTANVKRLGGAWFKELDSPTRTPAVVVGNTLLINNASGILALRADTGESLWEYKTSNTAPSRGGVAVGAGMVFCGTMNSRVIALDIKTGALIWDTYVGSSHSDDGGDPVPLHNEFIVSAPTLVNGVVTIGVSGGDIGGRGKIVGVDAATGHLLWTFYVIPTPGGPGSETWPQGTDALERGGGAVWTQGAADPELDMVYYGTGNPVPQQAGEGRSGDNLFANSVVALGARDGALKWHFQMTHHDLWEMDVSTPMVLYDANMRGSSVKGLAAMRTDGYLFLLDRRTGKPLSKVEERQVPQDIRLRTSATQPFPADVEKFGPKCADPATLAPGFVASCDFDPLYFDRPNVMSALTLMRQAPMSFDPDHRYFYVFGGVVSIWYRRVADPNVLWISHPPGSGEYGIYAAISQKTGKMVWQKRSPWGLFTGSGALSTAGGLVFFMEGDGNAHAIDATNGNTLWEFQTGFLGSGALANAGGVPLSTYQVGREQYVVAPMGRGLWAFRLGGQLPPRSAPPPPPNKYGFSGPLKSLPDGGDIAVGALQSSFVDEHVQFMDEYAFSPTRLRIKAGNSAKWTNFGVLTHTIVTEDGSWTTGPIQPGQSVVVSSPKPGNHVFFSAEFPWARGEMRVE